MANQVSAVLVIASLMFGLAIGQCPQLEAGDLGTLNTTSTDGLISTALTTGQGSQRPDVQLHSFNTVCLATTRFRDTYRFTSVVANYTCSRTAHAICNEAIPRVSQFDFQCVDMSGAPTWITNVFGSEQFVVSDPADGNLDTPLRTDCAFCVNPLQLSSFVVDNTTHCLRELSTLHAHVPNIYIFICESLSIVYHITPAILACSTDCDISGLQTCTDINQENCCNFFQNNTCVAQCNLGYVPNPSNDCGKFKEIWALYIYVGE